MKDNHIPMSWDHPDVNGYEKTISLKIPGYHHLYDMTDRLMTAQLRNRNTHSEAHTLIVGAGGGQEIITLKGRHPDWSFTGIDPSSRMLDIAKCRLEQSATGQEPQVSFIHGTIEQLPQDQQFDAATCLLVLHFVQGLSQKRELLQRIAGHLKPGAPFFVASMNGDPAQYNFSVQMEALKSHMLAQGIPLKDWERFAASIGRESDIVPAAVVVELLREAGFIEIGHYFGSYAIDGWFAVKG